jgi:hypothetical protein
MSLFEKKPAFGLETGFQFNCQRGESQLSDTILVPNVRLSPCTPTPPTPVKQFRVWIARLKLYISKTLGLSLLNRGRKFA